MTRRQAVRARGVYIVIADGGYYVRAPGVCEYALNAEIAAARAGAMALALATREPHPAHDDASPDAVQS